MSRAVLVLLRERATTPAAPSAKPIGRAAQRLAQEGITVLFGSNLTGPRRAHAWIVDPTQDRWLRVEDHPIDAVHDRFPSQTLPILHQNALGLLEGCPIGNPLPIILLCRDKLETQALLTHAGLEMPAVERDPARFSNTLERWGSGFLKPRYGALGRGVTRVTPGAPLPAQGEGALQGVLEPLFLQRAVPPPPGLAGCALRLLAQRQTPDRWHLNPAVARLSERDPVANVARGARAAVAADICDASTLEAARSITLKVCKVLSDLRRGDEIVELGVDFAVDVEGQPQLLEVNTKPAGRLYALADADPERFSEMHVEACARPLRYLATLANMRDA